MSGTSEASPKFGERQLFVSVDEGKRLPRYRRIDIAELQSVSPFVLMEIDVDEDTNVPLARTWWPAGMTSDAEEVGPPMKVAAMFVEVRLLKAVSKRPHILVSVAQGIAWGVDWAELIEN